MPTLVTKKKKKIQWNPVNTDTKGTRRSVRVIWVSVLSGISEKKIRTSVLLMQGQKETFLRQRKGFF